VNWLQSLDGWDMRLEYCRILPNVCISCACALDTTGLELFQVRPVMNTITNCGLHKRQGNSFPAEQTSLTPQKRPASAVVVLNKILPNAVRVWSKALTAFYGSYNGFVSSSSI
jgi:hypothetical protein